MHKTCPPFRDPVILWIMPGRPVWCYHMKSPTCQNNARWIGDTLITPQATSIHSVNLHSYDLTLIANDPLQYSELKKSLFRVSMHKTVAATMIGTSVIMTRTMTLSFLFKSLSSKCNWSLDNMSNSERQMVHHKTATSGGSNSYVAKMCGPITGITEL